MAVECCRTPQLCRERQIPGTALPPLSSLCSLSAAVGLGRGGNRAGRALGTHPSPLLHRGFWPSLSRASAIPELLLPRPSPSVQPCCSRTFLPKPWERGKKNITDLLDKSHPHPPTAFCPLSSPPPNPHPEGIPLAQPFLPCPGQAPRAHLGVPLEGANVLP